MLCLALYLWLLLILVCWVPAEDSVLDTLGRQHSPSPRTPNSGAEEKDHDHGSSVLFVQHGHFCCQCRTESSSFLQRGGRGTELGRVILTRWVPCNQTHWLPPCKACWQKSQNQALNLNGTVASSAFMPFSDGIVHIGGNVAEAALVSAKWLGSDLFSHEDCISLMQESLEVSLGWRQFLGESCFLTRGCLICEPRDIK